MRGISSETGPRRSRSRAAIAECGVAADHAVALLASRGVPVERAARARETHPALLWARSGAMALTGCSDGPPLLAPGPLAAGALGAALAFGVVAGGRVEVDGARLLGERAAIFGLRRRGRISPGGSCRLLRAADGWIAVNLARPDDRDMLPAWLGEGDTGDPWDFVFQRVATGIRLRPMSPSWSSKDYSANS